MNQDSPKQTKITQDKLIQSKIDRENCSIYLKSTLKQFNFVPSRSYCTSCGFFLVRYMISHGKLSIKIFKTLFFSRHPSGHPNPHPTQCLSVLRYQNPFCPSYPLPKCPGVLFTWVRRRKAQGGDGETHNFRDNRQTHRHTQTFIQRWRPPKNSVKHSQSKG